MAGAKWYPDTGGEIVRKRLPSGAGYGIWARRHGLVRKGRVCIGFTLRTANRSWLARDLHGHDLGLFPTQHEAAGVLWNRRPYSCR